MREKEALINRLDAQEEQQREQNQLFEFPETAVLSENTSLTGFTAHLIVPAAPPGPQKFIHRLPIPEAFGNFKANFSRRFVNKFRGTPAVYVQDHQLIVETKIKKALDLTPPGIVDHERNRRVEIREGNNAGNYIGRPIHVNETGDLYIVRTPLGAGDSSIKVEVVPFARHGLSIEEALLYVENANRAAKIISEYRMKNEPLPTDLANIEQYLRVDLRTNSRGAERAGHKLGVFN